MYERTVIKVCPACISEKAKQYLCSLHAAAPALLDALREIKMSGGLNHNGVVMLRVNEAIAHAEGRGRG